MRISDILKKKKTFSFEVFPPNPKNSSISDIFGTIDELQELNPDFISVTFKSSGDYSQNTIDLASYIKKHGHAEPLVHLTCGALDKSDVDDLAQKLEAAHLENVLALRGDKPMDFDGDYLKYFKHASELMAYLNQNHKFCLAGACYPEGHIECESLYEDLVNLKIKQDMGASFFITQLFYDNNYYYRLVRVAKKMGITIPIIPGIMPLTSATMFNKIMNMAGASIPFELRVLFDSFKNDKKAMYEIGVAFSVNQILELLANDADGIHIYTMNNAKVAHDIYRRIQNVIEKELR
ncbi:MAG: methylenetetrahydrofolate reductase [Bacteroidales bacterium]|nr:methylenetetrahydrofolate reductase [Bacteroidales bacterium]